VEGLKKKFNQLTVLNGIDIVGKHGPPENLFGNPQQPRTKQFLKQLGNTKS
jgi:hypothetical protein